jgi:uncharacterized delta-60 repeat protein
MLFSVLAVLLTLIPMLGPAQETDVMGESAAVGSAAALGPGDLDTSFSGDGIVLTDLGASDSARAIVLQPDGKLVVAGAFMVFDPEGIGETSDFALVRYHANGTRDLSFGDDGIVRTELGGQDLAFALVRQPDGKLVVAGSFDIVEDPNCCDTNVALVRYLPDGTRDPSFGEQGIVLTDLTDLGGGYGARALVLLPDDRLVVAGVSTHGGDTDFALARYHPDGALDTSFGGDGTVLTDLGSGLNGDSSFALAMQPSNGRLVAAGASGGDVALARYHTFRCNGVVVTRIGTAGPDTLVGTSGPDVILGFAGNDMIDGREGNDILCGGPGNDTLKGRSGNDILRGNEGTDTCEGGPHTSGDQAIECERITSVP